MQQFHGEKELFKSDHLDWIDAQTISRKCRVHSLNQYRVCPQAFRARPICCEVILWRVSQALKASASLQELEDETDIDFFSRFTYKVRRNVTFLAAVGSADGLLTLLIDSQPSEDKFGPETVPVYCACEVCEPAASLFGCVLLSQTTAGRCQ